MASRSALWLCGKLTGDVLFQNFDFIHCKAAEIVSLILDHGKLKSSDIISQLSSSSSKGYYSVDSTVQALIYMFPRTRSI